MENKPIVVMMLALYCLFLGGTCMNWQGAGQDLENYLPFIWAKIQDNIGTYSSNLSGFAKFLSDAYNKKWDPAWNVFVVETTQAPETDGVVVSYAFKDHWMWFNGWKYNGRTFSFIIWKDYNCKQWNTVDDDGFFGPAKASQIQMYDKLSGAIGHAQNNIANMYNDIWKAGSLMETNLRIQDSTNAYGILFIQSGADNTKTSVNGRFCSTGGEESYSQSMRNIPILLPDGSDGAAIAKIIILHLRDK